MAIPLVPWVAMWSGENEYQGPMQIGPQGIVQPPADYQGVHWIPFRVAQGVGVPLFGQVSTQRQIKCMRTPRCQVCGEKMDKANMTWVLNSITDPKPDGGPLRTATPPVCEACIPIAHEQCPHLAALHPLTVLRVTKFKVIGVFGDLFHAGTNGIPVGQVYVLLDKPDNLRLVLARMLVVELQQYKIETLSSKQGQTQ